MRLRSSKRVWTFWPIWRSGFTVFRGCDLQECAVRRYRPARNGRVPEQIDARTYHRPSQSVYHQVCALADTIKILYDDDAPELFKITLRGSASFTQLTKTNAATKPRALEVLQEAKHGRYDGRQRLDIIMLALRRRRPISTRSSRWSMTWSL